LGICLGASRAYAKGGSRQAETGTQHFDTAQWKITFLFELLAGDVQFGLRKGTLGAADLEQRVDFGAKTGSRLLEARANLAKGTRIQGRDTLLIESKLLEGTVVGCGTLTGSLFTDVALGAPLKFGLGNGLAGAAEGAGARRLLAKAKAFLRGALREGTDGRIKNRLRKRRHVTGEISFRKARGEIAGSGNTFLHEFAGQWGEGSAGGGYSTGSLKASQFVGREACNAGLVVGAEGLGSKSLSATHKIAGSCLNFGRPSLRRRLGRSGLLGTEAEDAANTFQH
jgi:hypothetical protein